VNDVDKLTAFRDLASGGGSSASKYVEAVVGRASFLDLARYEAATSLFRFMPGAIGIAMRRVFYRHLFARVGRSLVIGCGVSLLQPGRVSIGDCAMLDDFCCLSVRGAEGAEIGIGNRVLVGRSAVVNTRDGRIEIGNDTTLGGSCRIACSGGVTSIGSHVMIAAFCYVGGAGHASDRTDVPMSMQPTESRGGAVVEDDVWIGASSVVLDGSRIGRGSIIGACSMVSGEIPPYSVAVGSPARVIRTRKT